MTTKELMITGCVTVEGEANHQEICDRLEAVLREYGHHVAIDIPDVRDRTLLRDKRGRFWARRN